MMTNNNITALKDEELDSVQGGSSKLFRAAADIFSKAKNVAKEIAKAVKSMKND